ncbi:MAG: hypothetical protein K1X53_04920 [Candidatus Sumerlaeaceae bacterium]|nr:hypothetical protein [Candidatus Sumerlaeaceae bacterium]
MGSKVTVNEFKQMFREIGLDEAAMNKWHALFEQRHPESHQSFLEWLGLSAAQIEQVRAHSRG